MAKKPLKLAIMGASGVGKSVFLTSYFKYVTWDGEGKFAVSMADAHSIDHVNDLIRTLFVKKRPLSGTDKRYQMSFKVGQYNRIIALHDIPGGWTTSARIWENETVRVGEDLRRADGVLFFISCEDLMGSEDQAGEQRFKETQVFGLALELLRRSRGTGLLPRQDVPICIVFTKGDMFPEVKLSTLEEKLKAFLRNAQEISNSHPLRWFRVGKYVKCYKSVPLGQWAAPDKPPEVNRHENLIEPMEWLIERMLKAKKERRRRLGIIAAAALLFITVGVFALDRLWWVYAKNQSESFLEAEDFRSAKTTLANFDNRFTAKLIPFNLQAGGSELTNLRKEVTSRADAWEEKLLREQEAKHYASISALVDATYIPPPGQIDPKLYDDTVKRLGEYTSQEAYRRLDPKKFEKVDTAHRYRLLVQNMQELEKFLRQGRPNAFNALANILEALKAAPEEWQKGLAPHALALVSAWAESADAPNDPETLSRLMNEGEKLLAANPVYPEVTELVQKKVASWQELSLSLWPPLIESWVKEAESKDPDIAASFLLKKMEHPFLPDRYREVLQKAASEQWERTFNNWMREAAEKRNPAEALTFLQERIQDAPLPQEIQKQLETEIGTYTQKVADARLEEIKRRLGSVRGLPWLSDSLQIIESVTKDFPSIRQPAILALNERLDVLLDDELASLEHRLKSLLIVGEPAEAVRSFAEEMHNLRSLVARFRNVADMEKIENKLADFEKKIGATFEETEFNSIKLEFADLFRSKNPSESRANSLNRRMDEFLRLYPDSLTSKEVTEARDVLLKMLGGLEAILIVESTSCGPASLRRDTSALRLGIHGGGVAMSKTKNYTPGQMIWNERISLTLMPKVSLNFKLEAADSFGGAEQARDSGVGTGPFHEILSETIAISSFQALKIMPKAVTGSRDCEIRLSWELPALTLPADWLR